MASKEDKDERFEAAWVAYQRKGVKKVARSQWDRLPDSARRMAELHIPFYVATRERVYCKDFERYLRDAVFENPVYDNKGNLLYDPEEKRTRKNVLKGFQ